MVHLNQQFSCVSLIFFIQFGLDLSSLLPGVFVVIWVLKLVKKLDLSLSVSHDRRLRVAQSSLFLAHNKLGLDGIIPRKDFVVTKEKVFRCSRQRVVVLRYVTHSLAF